MSKKNLNSCCKQVWNLNVQRSLSLIPDRKSRWGIPEDYL